MGEVWILGEVRDGALRPSTNELATAARSIAGGQPVRGVLIGAGVTAAAADVRGVDGVLVLDDPRLEAYSPDGYARALADLMAARGPEVLVAGATARGRDLAPRVAAIAGGAVASDVTGVSRVEGAIEAVRPIYAGKAIARVRVVGRPAVITLRPNSVPAATDGGPPPHEAVPLGEYAAAAVVTAVERSASARPDVAEADIIVSGGRGMGGPEHFVLVEALADALGAAVGASRAVVDAGWRPHGDQVGQTGKTVSPSLYVACGISGAVQHLAGMKTSQVIVAINKDADAPIFSIADYGIVGDVFEVLPALTEAVRAARGG